MAGSFDDPDPRVNERARHLWEEAGRPAGHEADYIERAHELIAMEQSPHAATVPLSESRPAPAEPIEAVENQGEFPTLTDQGEEPTVPRWQGSDSKARPEDDEER